MNILFCQPTLERTGSEKSLFGITRVVRQSPNDKLYLLAGRDGPMRESFNDTVDELRVVRAEQLQKSLGALTAYIKSFWTVFRAVREMKRKHDISLVYVNTMVFPQAVVAARLNGLKCVVHIREIATKYPWLYYHGLLSLTILLANRIICVCQYILDQPHVVLRSRFNRIGNVIYNSSLFDR